MSPQTLYLENESWLRTVVRSRVRETSAVEDIMQNIALALVRQRDALDDVSKVGAWLYQIAVRQVLMYRRTTGRRRNFEERLLTGEAHTAERVSPDPVQRVIAAEQQGSVRRALEQLSELDRQILMLKYSEGWSYRQLAEHMGVSTDTIEYRLIRAKRRLRGQLTHLEEER
jgi:RNA polymerase sigma-70 factor (ECF subfamily)